MITLRRWSRLCPISLIRQVRITLSAGTHHDFFRNSSNIPPPLARYMREYELNSRLHETFWSQNNQRFSQELSDFRRTKHQPNECIFYQNYMEKYRDEFRNYHRETWIRAFTMILIEYQWMIYQVRHSFKSLYHNITRRTVLN